VFHGSHAIGRLASLILRTRRQQRVLVIRTDGLGDALLFEPALESLARTVSPQVIHLWAPKLTCELLRGCPTVARLMVIPRGFKQGNLLYFSSIYWRMKLGFQLGFWTFQRVIYPAESPEPLGNWLFASARAAQRWLNYGDTINQFEHQRQRMHEIATRILENRPGNVHELLRNEYLAAQWTGQARLRLRKPKLYLSEPILARAEARMEVWQAAARKARADEIVGVIPCGSMPVNTYPIERWTAALQRLWREHRAMPLLLGGPGDFRLIHQLWTALLASDVPVLRLDRAMPILEIAAVIGRLEAVISVDTGLAHLAVAQHVPTVVLVGGGNPRRFFPWPQTPHHQVLNIPMPCEGCNNRCTLPQPRCITEIDPAQIVLAWARLRNRAVPLEVYVAAPAAGRLQATG
ncbi:MAG TPA: glycosyltransferase family 9 protein, partial [Tepidisphaeraceae bacterium]|nr:glycosyltransferase family 9 protein [Tepidisphaeraceae bacterium]